MKPKHITTQKIFTKADWEEGRGFHLSALRDATGQKAEEDGLAIIGPEIIEHAWMTRHQEEGRGIVYRAAPHERATHVRITFSRQAVSRKVRL